MTQNINNNKNKGYISINWGRQGGILIAFLVVLLGYYGIIANIVMIDEYGDWISFIDMDKTILIWPYKTYLKTFFLPAILLFITCFFLTYKEDIALYGIKASLWIVPIIIIEAFIFYWLMFGISIDPFILQFLRIEGYFNILQLFVLNISGSLCGMKFKQFIIKRKRID